MSWDTAAPPPAEDVATARRSLWRHAPMVLGVLVLIGLVLQLGERQLLQSLEGLRWWTLLVVLPYGVFCFFDVQGWRCVLPRDRKRPSFAWLYAIRHAGEAVNDFTPTAYVGGEGIKAYLLTRSHVPATDAIVSVIVTKTALTAGQVLFIVAGATLFAARSDAGLIGIAALAVLAFASYLFLSLLVRWQQRGFAERLMQWVRGLFGIRRVREGWVARGQEVDDALASFYDNRGRDFSTSVFLHFCSWGTGALEMMIFAWLLGHPIGLFDAIVIEALNQPVKIAGLIIPGTLGVQEAGGVLAFSLLGLDPRLGLSVMLLRRLREVFYAGLGVVILRRATASSA
jgi:glycosyltransferase 2 family protein